MNTAATLTSDLSLISPATSRRGSIESVLSIQGRETDCARDTTDTEPSLEDDDADVEYEPVTESEDDALFSGDSSGQSDDDGIISTKVVEVSVKDNGELSFADSEAGDSEDSDSEIDLYDFWQCARCRADNNNPLYRYCQKCFKVRKNFFPPRPKRKSKRTREGADSDVKVHKLTDPIDSGLESVVNSQELVSSQLLKCEVESLTPKLPDIDKAKSLDVSSIELTKASNRRGIKRKDDSIDFSNKRAKTDYTDSDNSDDSFNNKDTNLNNIQPLAKSISDPVLTIEPESKIKLTKKAIANSLKEKLDYKNDLCIICCSEPKSGVFVHGGIAHICCCYKCSVKVWTQVKRCPMCNRKVSNVLKAVM